MVSFYDPKDRADQQNVEQILKMVGIEYATRREPALERPAQILVAEEDVPRAEELLLRR